MPAVISLTSPNQCLSKKYANVNLAECLSTKYANVNLAECLSTKYANVNLAEGLKIRQLRRTASPTLLVGEVSDLAALCRREPPHWHVHLCPNSKKCPPSSVADSNRIAAHERRRGTVNERRGSFQREPAVPALRTPTRTLPSCNCGWIPRSVRRVKGVLGTGCAR